MRQRESRRTPSRKKMIKEADLYYSRVIAPLQRDLRRAQHARHHFVIDEVWGKLQDALRYHRTLIDRATFVERP